MAEESHESFSNFEQAFGLERSEGENQNKPKSKPTNENNSAEEDWSVVESKERYYNKEGSNLKDIRIAALSLLAFARFFRYNELCNIAPNHIEFHSQYIKDICAS